MDIHPHPTSSNFIHPHPSTSKFFTSLGAKLGSIDKHGQTPLSKAVENGHEAIVRLLLERDSASVDRDIALVYAAKKWA